MTPFLPEDMPVPPKLKFHKKFQPCSVEEGEEMYPNGIFVFNITRLLAFIKANPEQYPVEFVPLEEIPCYDDGSGLNPGTVRTADLARPIVLAEISPGLYNVIDGNHRLGKARQDGVRTIPAYRVRCPQHLPFLTSTTSYEKYVEYWNSKVKTLRESARTRARWQTSEPEQA
jgi:hypothetical protein